jgi:hypothetical protein
MRAAGVSFAKLLKTSDGKAEYFVALREQKGEELRRTSPPSSPRR